MALGYRTFERGQQIKLFAVLINMDKSLPQTVVDPIVSIQRWDAGELKTLIDAAPLTHIQDNKYGYVWQTNITTPLDSYLVSYSGTADDIPFHDAIEILLTVDTKTPQQPGGVGTTFDLPTTPEPTPSDMSAPDGVSTSFALLEITPIPVDYANKPDGVGTTFDLPTSPAVSIPDVTAPDGVGTSFELPDSIAPTLSPLEKPDGISTAFDSPLAPPSVDPEGAPDGVKADFEEDA